MRIKEKNAPAHIHSPTGRRARARDHALHLAATRGIAPFSYSDRYGQMFATDIDADGLVTYKAASSF